MEDSSEELRIRKEMGADEIIIPMRSHGGLLVGELRVGPILGKRMNSATKRSKIASTYMTFTQQFFTFAEWNMKILRIGSTGETFASRMSRVK